MLKYISFLFLLLFMACGNDTSSDRRIPADELDFRPTSMPIAIYQAIADHGETKHIADKNLLLTQLKNISWADVSGDDIRAKLRQFANLSGLDEKIIALVERDRGIIDRPSGIPEDVFNLIRDFSDPKKNIREKNLLIPKIDGALKKEDILDRDYAIRSECSQFSVFYGLAEEIIKLLPNEDIFICPSGLKQSVCDVIESYRDKKNYIADKNLLARLVVSAINGPDKKRDAGIITAVDRFSTLSGLDSEIIRLLPAIASTLEKPDKLDQAIFEVIRDFNGESNFIPQKVAVVIKIDRAIQGDPSVRDAKIINAVIGYIDLDGLAEKVIEKLPPVTPKLTKPANMPDNVFLLIKDFKGEASYISEKSAVLDQIVKALLGPDHERDLSIKYALLSHFNLAGLASEIIKILPTAFIRCPYLVPKDVYILIQEFGGRDQKREDKNDAILKVQEILMDFKPEYRDARLFVELPHMIHSGKVLHEEIIKLLKPVLRFKPSLTLFSQSIYLAIKSAGGGESKFIREKNLLIDEIEKALKGDVKERDRKITEAVKKVPAFVGLDTKIISLLSPIWPDKPASIPQNVFDVIKMAGFERSFIAEKKALIEKLAIILAAPDADRDDKIKAAITGTVLEYLDLLDKIIELLPPLFVKQPAKMPKSIFDQIKDYKDPAARVKEKNALIRALGTALEADAATREAKIRNALARADVYFAKSFIDDILAALTAATYPADDGAIPKEIHELIRDYKGGATTHIREKVAVRVATKKALDGSPYARNTLIQAEVAKHAVLVGLDAAIIAKLLPVAIPVKPAGMSDVIYNDLIEKTRLDSVLAKQQEALNRVQTALSAQPNFGADRDREIMATVFEAMKAGLILDIHKKALEEFAKAAVKIINEHLPNVLQEIDSGLVRSIYNIIDGAGLTPFKRNALLKATYQAVQLGSAPQRAAEMDKAIAEHGATLPNDRKLALKNQVEAAQVLMARPAALDNNVFEEIKKLALTVPNKNFVIEQVALVAAQAERERNQSISQIIKAVNQTPEMANKVSGAFPIAAKYEGVILQEGDGLKPDEGSGSIDPADGLPKFLLVRLTRGDARYNVGDILYLHPDRYGKDSFPREKISYGRTVFFDRIAGSTADPRKGRAGNIATILQVKGYR